MKPIHLSLLATLTLSTAFLWPQASTVVAQDEDTAWTGAQWEYLVLRIDDRRRQSPPGKSARGSASQDKLNELGAKGWELVAVRGEGTTEPVFYFKRKKG